MKDRSITAFFLLALLSLSPSFAQEAPKPAPRRRRSRSRADRLINRRLKAILKDSPRHGEWVDVPLATEPGGAAGGGRPGDAAASKPIKTWIVYPERAEKAPVVIVIHEIFGMTDWVRATADQLAADGFIAIAPDLLSGKGPGGGATDSMKSEEVREAIRKLTPEEVSSRLNAVRDFALKLPAAAQKVGCIGFCWGGSQSFRYAAEQSGGGETGGKAGGKGRCLRRCSTGQRR
jgi:hypothetical protein